MWFLYFFFDTHALSRLAQRHHRRKSPLFVVQSAVFQPLAWPRKCVGGPFFLHAFLVVAEAQWSATVPTAWSEK